MLVSVAHNEFSAMGYSPRYPMRFSQPETTGRLDDPRCASHNDIASPFPLIAAILGQERWIPMLSAPFRSGAPSLLVVP